MQNYYEKGSYNVLCDVCGRKFKANQVKKRWDGFIVCPEDYEKRHPQDLIRVQERFDILPYTRDEPADQYEVGESCPSIFATEGIADYAVADCAIADYVNPNYLDDSILCTPSSKIMLPGVAVAGCALAGTFD